MQAMSMALVLTLFISAAASADDSPGRTTSAEAKNLTVSDALKALALDLSKLEYSDEPPGKLRQLYCETTLRDSKSKVRIQIDVNYTVALFSADRRWDPKAVRAATVRNVTITPAAGQ